MSNLYIGLISGTSIDAVDAALLDFNDNRISVVATHAEPIPVNLKNTLHALCNSELDTSKQELGQHSAIETAAHADIHVAELFAQTANTLLAIAKISSKDLAAIGSHGQTIRHRPPSDGNNGFSLQIGDPNTIAALTGITTVADFRRSDMALGGQGAPLAPLFHQAIAPQENKSCAFLNLGGIANLSCLTDGKLIAGFDTGPANGLMDAWIRDSIANDYDKNGEWALSGKANPILLTRLLKDPYFLLAAPKSTGREYFSLDWIKQHLASTEIAALNLSAADVQATLLELSVETIVNSTQQQTTNPEIVYACGGGVHNKVLMDKLNDSYRSIGIRLETTSSLAVDPDFVEAALFAWLAKQRIEERILNIKSVTGASRNHLAGGIYLA